MVNIFHYNGGAVVAMVGKDCVAIASDHRFGLNFSTVSTDRPKLHRLGPKLFVGLTGLGTDTQTVAEKLTFRSKLYALREQRELSPKALSALVSHMLYERRFGPYFTEPVVAGLDADGNPYIACMDLFGSECAPGTFVVGGTCSDSLWGMCESLWRPDLSPDELFETISQAMLSALDRDCLSGWGASVVVVTNDKVISREIKARMD
eukprot:TRINITY_DN10107_c0_g1_i2.p1 TRINITY_DN10107_c0_g1~~TRINITY_DN10107_c0_g1_i2.p1  ORF type:complete len:224 (-),score=62.55 TRINITY_DN10107_c0_g1_i2:103-720(-)